MYFHRLVLHGGDGEMIIGDLEDLYKPYEESASTQELMVTQIKSAFENMDLHPATAGRRVQITSAKLFLVRCRFQDCSLERLPTGAVACCQPSPRFVSVELRCAVVVLIFDCFDCMDDYRL